LNPIKSGRLQSRFAHVENAYAACPPEKVAIYGVSDGGFMTAQAAATDPRIGAWIASTPITDVAEVFRKEMGATFKVQGWLLRIGLPFWESPRC
jgi:cephalosporin-C deacetylase-like acetyl esterase